MAKIDNTIVSVIVPVYNVEKYINDCIESLISQTHANLEIILVDDNSPDKSGQICDEWSEIDKRIKVIHKPQNEGLNMARSTGVLMATGEWVSFVDSDDIVSKEYIMDLLTAAKSAKVDIAVALNQRFTEKQEIRDVESGDEIEVVRSKASIMRYAFVLSPDPAAYMIVAWGKLYKRTVLNKVDWGLADARTNEDELEAIQYYNLQKNGLVIVKKVLYYYRDNPDSIMNKPYTNMYKGKTYSRFEWLEKLYRISTRYFGDGKYRDELLYHNIMLTFLFLNKDLSKGNFDNESYRAFLKNLQGKVDAYSQISKKYPLYYEEARAFNTFKEKGNIFALWHDDRSMIESLRYNNLELTREVGEINAENNRLRLLNSSLSRELDEIKGSRAWKAVEWYRTHIKK